MTNHKGQPVTSVEDLGNWIKSRRVKLTIRWNPKAQGFEAIATSALQRTLRVRLEIANLPNCLGDLVDGVNEKLQMEEPEVTQTYKESSAETRRTA